MNFQGDFEGLFLTDILQLLCNDQKTGLLRVIGSESENRVFFLEGSVVYASSTIKKVRLGHLMKRDGLISRAMLEDCVAVAGNQNKFVGRVIADKGHASENTVKKYVKKQVEEIIYTLLFWQKGRFEYKDAKLNLKDMIVVYLKPMKLILDASRRMDELSVLKKVIPGDKTVFKISKNVEKQNEIKLTSDEWEIISYIDGGRNVRQIIDETGYDEFAVYKILYSFISYGLIEQKEEGKTAGREEEERPYAYLVTVYNDVLVTVKQVLEGELGDRAVSFFNECKTLLEKDHKEMLSHYHPGNQSSMNRKVIADALTELSAEGNAEQFLASGFNAYLSHVFDKAGRILGRQPLSTILKEVHKVLEYTEKYQSDSGKTRKMATDMERIIRDTQSRFGVNSKD